MKRQKNPDVLKRFPGGEDEPVTDPGTQTAVEGSGEENDHEEDDDDE